MKFYNRLTGKTQRDIPERLLLGQWEILSETETVIVNGVSVLPQSRVYLYPDISHCCSVRSIDGITKERSFSFSNWQIPSDLLLESLQYFDETRKTLFSSQSDWQKWVEILPLIYNIEKNILPQPLEGILGKYIGHLEEICHHPRTYLKLETDRLPISRAQRISPHAIEFLASHTEDWDKRTFRNVRPKRVLCLIREDLLDIYENKVTARLIDRLLEYLQKRIITVQTLQQELEQAVDFSEKTQNIYWRNRERICSLWGEQFQAETALKTATETLNLLKQLQYKLRGLLDTELYRAIPKQATVGNTLNHTNILINDRHYRYVDLMWQALTPWQRGNIQSPQKILETYQQSCRGFEAFCLLLVSRALTGNGTATDRGLGFKAGDLFDLQLGSSIEFNSQKGSITLKWETDGTISLEASEIPPILLIPLILPLSATEDRAEIDRAIREFHLACSNQPNSTVVILYPGTEDERRKLSKLVQRQINSLGNDYSNAAESFAILPISPLDLLSGERIARTIQWWLYKQYCQIYPFPIEPIHPSLLDGNSWILQKGLNFRVIRPPKPEEKSTFERQRSRLIQQAKSCGATAKKEFDELQTLHNFSTRVEEKFKPLLTCPTCHQQSDNFEDLDRQCFRCYCSQGCETEWGAQICGKCGDRYPYVQLSDLDPISRSVDREVGWVDRVFGRNVLAIPDLQEEVGRNKFICPCCGD